MRYSSIELYGRFFPGGRNSPPQVNVQYQIICCKEGRERGKEGGREGGQRERRRKKVF